MTLVDTMNVLPLVAEKMDTAVVFNMRDGVITVDRDGTIRTINPQAEQVLGLAASECVGQKFGVVIFERDLDRFLDVVIAAVGDPLTSHTEQFAMRDARGTRHLILKTSALVDPDTRAITGVIALISDVTEQVRALRDRIEFGYLSISTMIFMSLGSLAGVASFSLVMPEIRTPVASWSFVLLMTATTIVLLRIFQIPLAAVGLTRRNLRKSVIESIGLSALLFLVVVLIAVAIRLGKGAPVTDLFVNASAFGPVLLLYIPHAFLQELVCRGFLQGSFKRLMADRSGLPAIFAASVAFGVLHSHFGPGAILLTFVSGLIFGWIYNRHDNLAGVTICHIVAGSAAFATGLLHH